MGRSFYCSLCRHFTQYPDTKPELNLMLVFLHEEEKKPQLVFGLCLADFRGTSCVLETNISVENVHGLFTVPFQNPGECKPTFHY